MKIVVPVKYVPEPTAAWRFADDLTLDRDGVEGRLSELDEYAMEQAVRVVEGGVDAEIVALTVGPAKATDALRKALAMGAHSGVHVLDDAMHGSDAMSTSLVLAAAIRQTGFDVVVTGMASTDAEMSVVPAMVAERLGAAQVTFASSLSVDASAGTVTIRRDGDTASEQVQAPLPAVVSVTDQTGEPRYPAFKAIMASKKKPVTTWSLADLGISPSEVGSAAAAAVVTSLAPRPPKQAGVVVVDEGDGATQIADFLAERKFI
ncbi:MAG TPA: electron transfer flavoprotein subunit beta/FixA family protein [Kineosporiaceae bacterium]